MYKNTGTTVKNILLDNPLFLTPGSARAIIGLATLADAVVAFYYGTEKWRQHT